MNIPNLGSVETKAAVIDQSVEMDFYILGNETNSLIERERLKPKLVNGLMTCSQKRNVKSEDTNEGEDPESTSPGQEETEDDLALAEVKDEGDCEIPQPDGTLTNSLVSVSRKELIEE